MKTIGILAPSGVCDKSKLEKAVLNLENLGFNVKLADNIYDKKRYLAGKDECKIETLHKFYQDNEVDIILAARGGYGAIRLVNGIDYDIIRDNPKPICGFSDVTALLLMIYKKTGQTTFHSPMAISDFGEDKINQNTYNSFLKALNNESLEFNGNIAYHKGCAKGILWGGNLSTVVSLCGTDFIPNKDFIFFAEDLNEPVYKIDRMFSQLFNIERFKKYCKGVVLGDFLEVDNNEWLEEFFSEFSIPTAGGFNITHDDFKETVPIGKMAYLSDLKLVVE